jgi:UDP-glucuronate 4-epimerase
MERALITGAAGFIGSHLAAELLRRGCAVTCLDARSPVSDPVAAENLADLTGDPRFQFVAGDVTGGDLAMVCEGVRAGGLTGGYAMSRSTPIASITAAVATWMP